VDVLIVGAGISGISAAVHLSTECPDKSYTILERREQPGGTWDLFRYPGIRSDSDMHTLGFRFKPWTEHKSIADGPSILRYLEETAEEYHLKDKMEFGRHVRSASWSSEDSLWHVTVECSDGTSELWHAQFVWMCSGYYSYDEAHTPTFVGTEDFTGEIVHPQFWPEDLDYDDRRFVVIGSGATAVTLVPSLAKTAEHVTMLQRSPTYIVTVPEADAFANTLGRYLPDRLAYWAVRWKNVTLGALFYWAARRWPARIKKWLVGEAAKQLPDDFDIETHLTPRYNPWDQRICLVPDGDLFKALRHGTASIVTGEIDHFTKTGVQLTSGDHLDADVIVTATGLKFQTLGGASFDVDGEPLDTGAVLTYKGTMYSNVPNMAVTFGYTNASWTLKADLTSEWVCRLLKHMAEVGATQAVPRLEDTELSSELSLDFTSGYILRAKDVIPKQGAARPWKLDQMYPKDIVTLRHRPIDDHVLEFSGPGT